MDAIGILNRIETRLREQKMSANAVSLAAGMSADGIRNWKRRIKDGDASGGMNLASLDKVARALEVSPMWLIFGEGATEEASTHGGFREECAPFQPPTADTTTAIKALYSGAARNPAVTHRMSASFPDAGILAGDLLVCDLSREPNSGEIAIVTAFDEDSGASVSLVRRYLPPYLIPLGGSLGIHANMVTEPELSLRYPVVGVLRGSDGYEN